jgi:hypothetical protein
MLKILLVVWFAPKIFIHCLTGNRQKLTKHLWIPCKELKTTNPCPKGISLSKNKNHKKVWKGVCVAG